MLIIILEKRNGLKDYITILQDIVILNPNRVNTFKIRIKERIIIFKNKNKKSMI
jgi:hypothetical protein